MAAGLYSTGWLLSVGAFMACCTVLQGRKRGSAPVCFIGHAGRRHAAHLGCQLLEARMPQLVGRHHLRQETRVRNGKISVSRGDGLNGSL